MGGRIAAEGTHQALMRSSPIYQEIYASQLGNGEKMTRRQEDTKTRRQEKNQSRRDD